MCGVERMGLHCALVGDRSALVVEGRNSRVLERQSGRGGCHVDDCCVLPCTHASTVVKQED